MITCMVCVVWISFGAEVSQLFKSDHILNVTLEYDIKGFRKDKGDKRRYHPATLMYLDATGKTIRLPVEIMARGKLRRTFLNCLVPPFKMKFAKSNTAGTLFEDQTNLKLVTHCKNSPDEFEQFYLGEYLCYRLYAILTPLSFRVRLVQIQYVDSKKDMTPFTATAFFIESYKHMAKRNNARTTTVESIELTDADFATSTLVSVFEYMIGNTDWSIAGGHNIKWLVFNNSKKFFPVPYDFDLSGIIDASYARPDEQFPIKSVRERLFRGFCTSIGQFNQTFIIFHKHKKEILELYSTFPLLPEKIKNRCLKYLDEFYQIIVDPKLVKRYFVDNYRGRPQPKR